MPRSTESSRGRGSEQAGTGLEHDRRADSASAAASDQRSRPGLLRVAYADPPYPGMSGFYKGHPDFDGEVDHGELVERMCRDYDGWVLHTAAPTLKQVLEVCPDDTRIGSWVKPFASFKRNVTVAYAWEPVLFWGGRAREKTLPTVRDWIAESITLKRGLTGAKPEAVCRWAFDVLGMRPDDQLDDLFPGSGAVQRAWEAWRDAPTMRRLDYTGEGAKAEATIPMEDVA